MMDYIPQTPEPNPNALSWLAKDLEAIGTARRLLTAKYPVRAFSQDEARCFEVAGDLWLKQSQHSRAVLLLLRSHFFPSAQVVSRVAYEAAINLVNLLTVGDRLINTRLFEARMFMEIVEAFPWAIENAKSLNALPEPIRALAQEYKRKRLPWAGVSLERMAQRIGVRGHAGVYTGHSWPVHSRIAGLGVEYQPQLDGTTVVHFTPEWDKEDVLYLAEHVRMMARRAYEAIARTLYHHVITLSTPDPAENK